jgi:hypothetical protein
VGMLKKSKGWYKRQIKIINPMEGVFTTTK